MKIGTLSGAAASAVAVAAGLAAATAGTAQQRTPRVIADSALQATCEAAAVQSVASAIASSTFTVRAIKNSPFKGATRFVAASETLPAFCQVVGSFVTNPATGKTANFLATFPANWNGKYLQSGCSSHCGQFFVSNPAMPSFNVTAQGETGEVIRKGYAHFATDEGHESMDSASWALRADGTVDQDMMDDFLYRADRTLARGGKEFATAFYAKASGVPRKVERSYFNGCSGGGRDALVAASYFPEEFDGIIAGSAYNLMGTAFQMSSIGIAGTRSPAARVTPALLARVDTVVKAQCDGLDGVKDGVIQNPAACNFRADRDLPKCAVGSSGDQCFTSEQIETVSTMLTAVTDEHGAVIQPGYSVSDLQVTADRNPLADPVHSIFVHRNDPRFDITKAFSLRSGGPGPITAFRAVIPASEVAMARTALGSGIGHFPENAGNLRRSGAKLLMWHNLSDELLSPYMSINYYKQLAAAYGGYPKLQQQVRLFTLPGTSHCSISGIAPNSFDALAALEEWVEHGKAPDALRAKVVARQFVPGAPQAAALNFPNWTATLCKFPEMARFRGAGDLKDASNWTCSPSDKRMLRVGESGRLAGVR